MPIHARLIHSWELLHPHQFLAPCYLPRSPRHHTLAAAFLWSCYEPGDAPAARGQHSLHPGMHGAQPTSLCCAGSSWTLLSWLCFSRGFRARGGNRGPRAGDALACSWTLPLRACGKAGRDTAPTAEPQPSFARGTWSGWGADGHSPIVRFCLMLAAQGACMDPEQLAGWAATVLQRRGVQPLHSSWKRDSLRLSLALAPELCSAGQIPAQQHGAKVLPWSSTLQATVPSPSCEGQPEPLEQTELGALTHAPTADVSGGHMNCLGCTTCWCSAQHQRAQELHVDRGCTGCTPPPQA